MDFASIDLEISIHVPREGDDLGTIDKVTDTAKFQSTSPVRGTTDAFYADVSELT